MMNLVNNFTAQNLHKPNNSLFSTTAAIVLSIQVAAGKISDTLQICKSRTNTPLKQYFPPVRFEPAYRLGHGDPTQFCTNEY